MINAKTVRGTLIERLQGDGALLKDFADLGAFASVTLATTGEVTGPGLVMIITKTAGACLSAATRIMGRLSKEEGVKKASHSYDRFRVLFYVACQRAYFEALDASPQLKQLNKERTKSAPINLQQLTETFSERAAQIEEAEVRFHYSIQPLANNMPLYDAYSDWLSLTLRAVGVPEPDRLQAVKAVADEARRRFTVALAAQEPVYEWMRDYLALSASQEDHEVLADTLSELAAIRTTLEGWKDLLNREASRRSEYWKSYRALIRSLPDQKESMYNEDFGVSKVFVAPRIKYHRAGLPGDPDEPEIVPDLGRLLGALVSSRVEGEDLIVLCGGPGSGKSTLCRILASELAKDETVHPIFLKLRRCRETVELGTFIEDSLRKEGVIQRLADLHLLPNVVLILDGFDELVLASRTRLKHFFTSLLDDISMGPLRRAKVIVSGRDTLFPRGEGLPRGSHVLNVLPFDEPRVTLWGERWRALYNASRPGTTFHPELLLRERPGHSSPLRHLVSWPLTLHLLAKVHTAGLVDLGSVKEREIEKAYLYRSILKETAARQADQATGGGRLAPEQMREFLRTLAWSMYSRASDSMAIEDVLPLAKDFFPGQDESALTELSEVAVVNAPEIKKGEETGFEFVHKSFSEYLVAERIARSIEHVSHRVADIDGRETWQFSSEEAARKVAEVLAIRVLPGEVQEMLEPMLGSFVAFHRGAKVEDAVSSEIRLAGLLRVRLRFQELYCGILNGSALGIVMEATKLFPLVGSPLEANACYCTGVVLVGAAASRRLQAERPKSSSNQGGFSLEPFEGALWRWLMLVHAGGVYVDGEIATRLYEGIDLHCSHGDKRKTADSTFPIKLGLLQGRPGYQSSLREALDQHQHAIQGIVEIMVAMNVALLRLKEEGREGVGSSREEVPMNTERKMRRRRQGLQVRGELTHFAEHVGREIENTGSSLEHTLEKCGLLTVQRVKPTRTRRRMTPSGPEPKDEDVAGSRASAFELFQMPAERIQHIYRSIATIFCGLDGEDYLDYLDWIISEDPRKTKPGRKRGRSVPRQE